MHETYGRERDWIKYCTVIFACKIVDFCTMVVNVFIIRCHKKDYSLVAAVLTLYILYIHIYLHHLNLPCITVLKCDFFFN